MTDKDLLFMDGFQMAVRKVERIPSSYDGILFKRLPSFDRFHKANMNNKGYFRYYVLTPSDTVSTKILVFYETGKILIEGDEKHFTFSVEGFCQKNDIAISDIENGCISYDEAREKLSLKMSQFLKTLEEVSK